MHGTLLVAALAGVTLGCGSTKGATSTEWTASTPEEQGIDSAALADIFEKIEDEGLPIDSLLVARNGFLVLDAYFYPYLGDRPHDVASVTKSVTSTLIGIAIDEGLLEVDQPLVSLFPELDVSKSGIELRHLLSMSSGLACGVAPGEQELFEMIGSDDFVAYALTLPVAVAPGLVFAYCSPGSHLLSAAITQVTGVSARAFAEQRLFGPLEITEVTWPGDPQGISRGWGDLQLLPRDAAKLGQVFLDGGEWNGKQIISRDWVDQATSTVIGAATDGTGYGYQWWIRPSPFEGAYQALGRGGQAIVVWPEHDLVIVYTSRGVDVLDDITPLIIAALQSDDSLEPNPGENARLDASIEHALEAPEAQPIPQLPVTADAMSNRRYRLDDNPFDTRCVLLRFDSKSEVTFELTTLSETFQMPVGMDGVPRFSESSPTGIPVGLVGEWTASDVFLLLYDEVAGPNHLRIEVTVEAGADEIEVQFSDPGRYFPTTTVSGTVSDACP